MVHELYPGHEQGTDPRRHAEAVLARARSRDRRVITPDLAGSPADSAVTVILPRYRIAAADARAVDPDATQELPLPVAPFAPSRRPPSD